jgi:hypothetical protein
MDSPSSSQLSELAERLEMQTKYIQLLESSQKTLNSASSQHLNVESSPRASPDVNEQMELKLLKVQYEREKRLVDEKVRELASYQSLQINEQELRA